MKYDIFSRCFIIWAFFEDSCVDGYGYLHYLKYLAFICTYNTMFQKIEILFNKRSEYRYLKKLHSFKTPHCKKWGKQVKNQSPQCNFTNFTFSRFQVILYTTSSRRKELMYLFFMYFTHYSDLDFKKSVITFHFLLCVAIQIF